MVSFVQRSCATKLADTTDVPAQDNSCLISCLTQRPCVSLVLGIVLCAIGVAALAGVALLSLGVLSGSLLLCSALVGLACLSLLVGCFLVYQGGTAYRLPSTPASVLRHLEKYKAAQTKKMAEVEKKRDNATSYRAQLRYTLDMEALCLSIRTIDLQCADIRRAMLCPSEVQPHKP